MKPDDILRGIELPDAISPEERLRRIARLILKAIRLGQARKEKAAKPVQEPERKEPA